jgi:hypothetical protein
MRYMGWLGFTSKIYNGLFQCMRGKKHFNSIKRIQAIPSTQRLHFPKTDDILRPGTGCEKSSEGPEDLDSIDEV